MNYRHQFHAGNFADVVKHALVLAVWRSLQQKPKGLLFLDTHAGRGSYDLALAARGDTLAREPEWPHGIGRIEATAPGERPAMVQAYAAAVQAFAARAAPSPGDADDEAAPRPYPGSPWLVAMALRPQDRMVLCERHPEEAAALASGFARSPRVRVEATDGYAAVRAHLPPRERRALVLIDPPYEATDEFDQVERALREGIRRLSGGTFLVWYPLTERARVDAFFDRLSGRSLPPTLIAELTVAGPASPLKLKGCGLLLVNPPWRLDRELAEVLPWLATTLRRAPGGEGSLRWLVPE